MIDSTNPAEARLGWLVGALQDPTTVSAAEIAELYDVGDTWRDWTPEREVEFLTSGPHSGSRPLAIERVTRGDHHDATAILVGADAKRWAVTCWSDPQPPHRLTGARIVPAPPEGMEIRLATPADGPALTQLERRAPLRLGKDPLTFMTFDHGDDYFAPSRLMGESTIYVAEVDGWVCGVYCGVVQTVEVDGERKDLFLEHHVRIDPEAPRGGVFWALCAYGRDTYARSADSIAFYVALENHAVRKFVDGTPSWSVQPLRALLPCRPGDADDAGRASTEDDAPAIVEILNACHTGSALFAPYTTESLTTRLARDPRQYGWGDVRIAGGAAVGIGRELLAVTKERAGDVQVSRRALALDHGFVPGHDDDYRELLRSTCRRLAAGGATHLVVFTSDRSPSFDVVSELAEEIEVFDFWAFDIPEPAALAERGFYVDPVYF